MRHHPVVSFLLSCLPGESPDPIASYLLARLDAPALPSVVAAPVASPAAPDVSAHVSGDRQPVAAPPAVEAARLDPADEWRAILQQRVPAVSKEPAVSKAPGKRKAAKPRAPTPAVVPQGWTTVVDHLPQLERLASRMARIDARIDASDLLQELLADLVASASLYDEKRGPWFVWAKTRCWLARTRAIRNTNLHAPRGRTSLSEPEDAVSRSASLAVGEWGTAARCEALADIQQLHDRSGPDARRELIARIVGESTGRGGEDRLDEASRGAALGMDLRG